MKDLIKTYQLFNSGFQPLTPIDVLIIPHDFYKLNNSGRLVVSVQVWDVLFWSGQHVTYKYAWTFYCEVRTVTLLSFNSSIQIGTKGTDLCSKSPFLMGLLCDP